MKLKAQTQKPHEVMDEVCQRGDAQELGSRLGISPQMIRNWCREPESEDTPHGTGTKGPLDRLDALMKLVKEDDGNSCRAYPIGQFVCAQLGGLFVPAPNNVDLTPNNEFFKYMDNVLKEVGEGMEVVRKIWCEESPGLVSRKEFTAARREIEESMAAHYQMLLFLEGQMSKVSA
jgi:hypothetical protein